MIGRELFNHIMKSLESHGLQLQAVVAKQESIDRRIDGLRPQSYLPMIARPVQGVDYGRTCNVAQYVDEKVKSHNSTVGPNAPRYLEFAEGRSHDDLNRSALATIGGIMVRKFGNDYGGEKTWEKLYRKKPKACEEVLEEARMRPELAVFSQVDGQWCLRELAKNKLKSIKRSYLRQAEADNIQTSRAANIITQNEAVSSRVHSVSPNENDRSNVGPPFVSRIETSVPDRTRIDNADTDEIETFNERTRGTHGNVERVLPAIQGSSAVHNATFVQREQTTSLRQVRQPANHSDDLQTDVQASRRGPKRRAPRSGLTSRNVRSRNTTQ